MKISTAEAQVMDALWRQGGLDAEEATSALEAATGWTEPTVRTLLGRLVTKKAVSKTKEGRRYVYRPLVERGDYLQAESQGLLDRLFDGQIGNFVAHFSERQNLSEAEIAELRTLIERLGNGR